MLQQKRYKKYIVNDINVSIISFYKAIQTNADKVIKQLKKAQKVYNNHSDKESFYFETRELFNQDKSNYVRFWLLMKAGFNGLYRENKKGFYNVSFGKKEKISFDEDMIREISVLIQDVEFYNMDYKDFYTMLETKQDTFIYNDPPYCNSQKYTATAFDNKELADFVSESKFDIAISDVDNETSNEVYKLFSKVFIKTQKRVINIKSVTEKREVLYVNYA